MKGTAVAILDENGRLLLLKRSTKAHWMPGKWGLPGGKTEKGETTEQCAMRETLEETQLHVDNLVLLPEFRTAEVDIFYAPTYNGQVVLDFEHDDHAWVTPAEVKGYETTPRISSIFKRVREL